jgi:hypothetical protein
MPALRELQESMAAELAGESRAELALLLRDPRRLAIHRHHVMHSLAAGLAATFPTVQALVGPEYFRQTAARFVGRHLPAQPVLAEYGEQFADFVAVEESAHGLPYLADMARLDWALHRAAHSSRLPAVDLSEVAPEALLDARLAFGAAVCLVRSRYPIDRIWRASQTGAPDERVDLAWGPADLLVLNDGFLVLSRGEPAFVEAIAAGCSIEAATRTACAVESGFDVAACIVRLRACEVFVALQQ